MTHINAHGSHVSSRVRRGCAGMDRPLLPGATDAAEHLEALHLFAWPQCDWSRTVRANAVDLTLAVSLVEHGQRESTHSTSYWVQRRNHGSTGHHFPFAMAMWRCAASCVRGHCTTKATLRKDPLILQRFDIRRGTSCVSGQHTLSVISSSTVQAGHDFVITGPQGKKLVDKQPSLQRLPQRMLTAHNSQSIHYFLLPSLPHWSSSTQTATRAPA